MCIRDRGIDVLAAVSRRAVHDVLVSRGEGRRGQSCEKQHTGGGDEEWEGGWRKAAHLVVVISIRYKIRSTMQDILVVRTVR